MCLAGLFRDLAESYAQRLRHAFAIGRICLKAVADMAELNLSGRTADGPGRIFKKGFLLFRAHQAEQQAGLGVVVIIILAKIPVIGSAVKGKGRLGKLGLLLPLAIAVGLVAERAAVVAVDTHGPVAVIAVKRAAGFIDRNQVMVHPEAVALRIAIGKKAALQHLVGRKPDAGHNARRVEGRLLDLGKIVFRVAVQLHDADLDERIILLEPDLAEIKGMEAVFCRVLFRHDLHKQGPAREVFFLNAFIQVALMAFPAFADHCLCLCIGQVFDALLGAEMEFDPAALIFGIDEAEGMAAETVHVAVAGRNAPVAHDDGDLVQGLGQRGPEVPVVQSAAQVGAGVAFDGMIQVGKFQRVAQEKHRGIIAHKVPVALLGVKLHGKAAYIALGIGSSPLAGNG